MTESRRVAGQVWLKRTWNLRNNPFPTTGIARLGGDDQRENGLLYEPAVNADKFEEALEKYVLGAAFSGLRFGYLWSVGTGPGDSDARGFGKSVLMQHLVAFVNEDYGRQAYLACGLDEEDAREAPMCALLTSFDTAQIRSLNAALFTAVEFAVDFFEDGKLPLAANLREQLVQRIGTEDLAAMVSAVIDVNRSLKGRTLGPPNMQLVEALCSADRDDAADLLDAVKPATRTRNGGVFLSTFLLFAAAAGMKHVLLCCDQLEDLASPTTAKQKRDLETERFRDVILETLPMADMLSVVVTMHPRAALTIGTAWQLADLPPFEITEANRHRVVVLPPLHSANDAEKLLVRYLNAARKEGDGGARGLHPFTDEAIVALFERSNRKPRDILRKAHGLVEAAASDNVDVIDDSGVIRYLDAIGPETDDELGFAPTHTAATSLDWSNG